MTRLDEAQGNVFFKMQHREEIPELDKTDLQLVTELCPVFR